jgi:TP901 family phage tail tape measure protein
MDERAAKHAAGTLTTMRDVSSKVFAASSLAAVGIGLLVKKGIDFEHQMKRVQAISKANTKELEAMKKQAIDLSKAFTYSPKEIAEAQEILLRADITKEQLPAILKPALALSRLEDVTTQFGAEAIIQMQSMFGWERTSQNMEKLASMMSLATDLGPLNLRDMFEYMKYAGFQHNQLGQSPAEAMALAASISQFGLKGSMAGTGISNFLSVMPGLAEGTKGKKQYEALARLGLTSQDFIDARTGELKTAGELLTILAKATRGMSDTAAFANLEVLFNKRGVRPLLGLLQQINRAADKSGTSLDNLGRGYKDILAQLEKATGKDLFGKVDTMQSSILSQWKLFTNALEDLGVAIVEITGGPLVGLLKFMTKLVDLFTKFIRTPVGQFLTAAAIAAVGFIAAFSGISFIVSQMGLMVIRLGMIGRGLKSIAAAGGISNILGLAGAAGGSGILSKIPGIGLFNKIPGFGALGRFGSKMGGAGAARMAAGGAGNLLSGGGMRILGLASRGLAAIGPVGLAAAAGLYALDYALDDTKSITKDLAWVLSGVTGFFEILIDSLTGSIDAIELMNKALMSASATDKQLAFDELMNFAASTGKTDLLLASQDPQLLAQLKSEYGEERGEKLAQLANLGMVKVKRAWSTPGDQIGGRTYSAEESAREINKEPVSTINLTLNGKALGSFNLGENMNVDLENDRYLNLK